jgi:hypothetical protein
MPVKSPRTYFADQLSGEPPLTQKTASRLCDLAADIRAAEPWSSLAETNLIAVQRAKNCEPDFISVLGAAGKHRGFFVYPGIRGYAWTQEMVSAERQTAQRLLMTENESFQVNFVPRSELASLDVDLMNRCRCEATAEGIEFRSVRKGWFPWHINEEEGRRLCTVMEAFMALVYSGLIYRRHHDLWPESQSVMPMMFPKSRKWDMTVLNMQLTRVKEPRLWVAPELLRDLPTGPKSGAMCLGDIILPGSVGQLNERPAVVHMVAAVDNRSGYAFSPRISKPGELLAVSASEALLSAIKERRKVPEKVFVPEPFYAEVLSELGRVVGFELQVRRHLPMLEELFRELTRYAERPRGGKPASIN